MRRPRSAFAASAVLPRALSHVLISSRGFTARACAALVAPGASPSPVSGSVIREAPMSAYVHLPFCVQKCGYCDFAVTVSTNPESHKAYVSTLVREIEANFSVRPAEKCEPLRTVYLGGGTPSLIAPSELGRVLDALSNTFGIADNAEVTAEMDPATFDYKKAAAFHAAGVTRVSLGVQSLDDELLAACGRVHRRHDALEALKVVKRAGFRNVSADIMAGLPGQNVDAYCKSLEEVIRHEVNHVSVYDLTIEEGTRFGRLYTPGVSPLPEEKESVRMLEAGEKILAQEGFERYEISNYAKGSSFRSRHNMAYWHGMPFYGFGLGATSLVDGIRFARPRLMSQYRAYVQSLQVLSEERANSTAVLYPGAIVSSPRDMLDDYLINGFRLLIEGVGLSDLRHRFSNRDAQRLLQAVQCSGFLKEGLVEVIRDKEGAAIGVKLTQKGAMIENSVVATLMEEGVWKFSETEDEVAKR